ncbi:MAG TPA: Asp23/Gls24 family envelope stress response protein [Chloroflexi bacterium]|nr:Asp23/Gls24 family envelope stress response protein [Chloroflexota bacterium]HPO57610.1 Asp23/Gls24 family envelope stress response protein [Anaerolineaceae bacterium]
MTEPSALHGNIYISHRAISTIAHQAALESYGVVGLAAKNLAAGLANVIVKDPTMGVDVRFDGHSVEIDLYIVVEYGTRITAVARSVANTVRYQIEKALGLEVTQVNVHVRGLRVSDTD